MPMRRIFGLFGLLVLLFTLPACGAKGTSAPQVDTVGTAVAAALTAVPPRPASTPYPTYTPFPTPDLAGLFCEYRFCIGHQEDISFFDAEVVGGNYVEKRSAYEQGYLLGISAQQTIQIFWQGLAGAFDANSMITFILLTDQTGGILLTEDIGGRPVSYTVLASTPSSDLQPFGLAAAWQCGDREFGWKIYTSRDGQALDALHQAMNRFTCSKR